MGPEIRTLSTQAPLWRIHMTSTNHPQAWNRLRTWGPLASARWDAHPLPEGEHPSDGAAYLGFDVVTCLAEVFQATRFVDIHTGAPYVTLFSLTRPLRLIDVTGDWLLRAGARSSVALGKKSRTREWARAIRDAWPDLDGVYSRSAVAGAHECVTLWGGSESAFASAPLLSTPLSSPAIVTNIKIAAESIRYSSNC
ncbi:RES family NAD+ phosphorylase [Subtercola endophyticus]|uniref:RES family NAD+ phosphorylase n=1 Tax=Subtercola endophyticus TaxID=2895559 RepID=UPI0021023098|nr:RES family NAD+ phosphorylase [Subtercola endophyticus]